MDNRVDDLSATVKEAMRRAVLTLTALPDPDRRYLRYTSPQIAVVRDAAEAYGWTPARVHFFPTPFDCSVYLDVLGWLSWYERTVTQGGECVRLVIAWATGSEYWKLSKRFACSESTLRRRIDRVADTIASEFRPDVHKILLDGCNECTTISPKSWDEWNSVPDSMAPLPYWVAEGPKPCADTSIPTVAFDRNDTIKKLERAADKRARRARRRA